MYNDAVKETNTHPSAHHTVRCPNCRHHNAPGSVQCSACGQNLARPEPPATAAAPDISQPPAVLPDPVVPNRPAVLSRPVVPNRPVLPNRPEAPRQDEASRRAALSAEAREAVESRFKMGDLTSIVLWTNDLGISSPRQRGLKRGQYALIMLLLGMLFVALPITAIKPVAIAPLMYGAIALTIAVVELLTNHNWMDNPILLRLLFLVVLIPLSVILALAFGALGLVISNGLTDLFK